MKIVSGKMTKETLDALLEAKGTPIWDARDEIYNERTKDVLDENELDKLDKSYRFKLIEYLNQPVEDYYLVLCY